MPSIPSLFLLGLPLMSARSIPDLEALEDDVVAQWEEGLKALPGESLKAAVEGHLRPKYREGIFKDGHDAIEAVRSDDPELASKLVDWAKSDATVKDYLRKRQSDNTTTSATTISTTSPVIVTDSTTSAVSLTTQTTVLTTSMSQSPPNTQGQSPSSSPNSASSSFPPSLRLDDTSDCSEFPPLFIRPFSITVVIHRVKPALTTAESTESSLTSVSASSTLQASEPITAPTVSASPSTQTGVLVPVEVTTTAQGGSTVVSTTQAFQNTAPTSVVLQITTTNDDGATITTSKNAPAVIITMTNSEGSVLTTASPLSNVAVAPGGSIVASSADMVTTTDSQGDTVVLSRPTPGGVYTTTDSGGEVAIVTYTPGGGVVSQLEIQTTVLPNGQRSTITSFAQVGGATNAPAAGGSASASGSGRPGLQSGAGMPSSWYAAELAIFVGAAIGLAGLIL
ncbi:hypothetical protein AC578_5415 [Pseudocercospora eumusae]|uniref:Uncharacterized protein n=1 Tax=Pseudocercospora eumusae TaxID=321146 RepID=A0A139HJZ1_9PEZI|nr:hypothetical protein AC578_5415 [Pseudocercospora eumusae]